MQDTWQNYVMVPVLRIAPTYTDVEESFCTYTDSKWVSNFHLHIHKRVFLNPYTPLTLVWSSVWILTIRMLVTFTLPYDIIITVLLTLSMDVSASIMEVIVNNNHWFAAYQLTLQFVLKFVAYNIWSPCCLALPMTMILNYFLWHNNFVVINFVFLKDKIL
jgi:hypothetical protein